MRQSVRRGAVVVSFLLALLAVVGLWLKALPPETRGRVLPDLALRWIDPKAPGSRPEAGATAKTARDGAASGDAAANAPGREANAPPPEPGPPRSAETKQAAHGSPEPDKATSETPGDSPGGQGPGTPGDVRQASRAEAPPAAPPPAPSFDIVRVEPSGESVIAGRGAPGATIEMLRGGAPFARTLADPSGLFAFVPPALPPGTSDIALRATSPDGSRAQSRENVVVEIGPKRDTPPLVTLMAPDRPTVVLSTPEPPAPAKAEARPAPDRPPAPAPRRPVRIVSVDAEEGGKLYVSGQATPGASVRLYLNDTLIAPGSAGADGQVSFAIGRGVRPGKYKVRLDDVDPVSGEVKTRAEIGFGIPEPFAVASTADAGSKSARALDTRPGGEAVSGPFGAAPPARPAPRVPGEAAGQTAAASPQAGASRAPSDASGARPGSPSSSGQVAPSTTARSEAQPGATAGDAGSSGSHLPGSMASTAAPGRGIGKTGSGSADNSAVGAPLLSPPPASGSAPGSMGRDAPIADSPRPAPSSSSSPSSSPSSSRMNGEATGARSGSGTGGAPAPGSDPSRVVVPEITTAAVSRGDNLWSISRRVYGRGVRYTMIFGANKDQIRDPDLIYPGQFFVLPPEAPAQP